MQARDAASWIGKTIDGRYLVEEVLGQGGMGVVLRVRHKYTGVHAALKLLHPHLRMHGDLAQRFLAEARAPAAIGHPGIVHVVDAGFSHDGELYLVMELLKGRTLAAAMKAEAMPWAVQRRIVVDMLAALGAAHTAGFIHRDLKPENVFLADPQGALKLLDFGIAKVLDEGLGARGETQTGMIMGTVAYMSPEQLRDSRNVDARTDLWAVGVMIYELACGQLPYQAETLGNLLVAMMTLPARPMGESLADVPPALDAFMRRALAVDVHQRFGSAAEMAAALQALHVPVLSRRSAGPDVFGATMPLSSVAAPQPQPPPQSRQFVPPAPSAVPVAAAAAAPVAAAAPAPVAVPVAAAVRAPSGAKNIVLLIALAVAAGLAVALGLVLTHGAGQKVAAALPVIDAAPAPPPDPPPPPDAAPDPGPKPKPKPMPAPTPSPKATTPKEICAAACATSQKKCGIQYTTPCIDGCLVYPAPALACLSAAGTDCDAIGNCGFAVLCGSPPAGRASCAQSAQCIIGCGQNGQCTCGCVHAMSPRQTNELLGFFSCAIKHCAAACARGLNATCSECVDDKCEAAADACVDQ